MRELRCDLEASMEHFLPASPPGLALLARGAVAEGGDRVETLTEAVETLTEAT